MFSYKTSMAMKNKETWEFAHIHFGKLWRIFGVIMLPISIAFMFYIYGEDINTVGLYGMIFCLLQCGIISIPIIFTEIALNKKFDKNGDRRFL
ncbi:MAG: SdpI family protein [Oscillospiraceae bacterium]|nr:SdpI family protein [Oscillospiraceae bacterium]